MSFRSGLVLAADLRAELETPLAAGADFSCGGMEARMLRTTLSHFLSGCVSRRAEPWAFVLAAVGPHGEDTTGQSWLGSPVRLPPKLDDPIGYSGGVCIHFSSIRGIV